MAQVEDPFKRKSPAKVKVKKGKRGAKYMVSVVLSIFHPELEESLEIEAGETDFSGFSFFKGTRDLGWYDLTLKQARNKAGKVAKFKYVRSVSVVPDPLA